jgi:1-acyl-sn-glycerol-3-phosphate acyltransferase
MIRACKSLFLEHVLVAWLRFVFRHRFFGVFVRGTEHFKNLSPDRPVIVCANHTNWWDGFVLALLIPHFPKRSVYVVQYEKLLQRYRPLRWLGAFGLEIHGSALPGLRYALQLLRNPASVLWIFPQGVLVPQWVPITVKPGALWLARRSNAQVLPVAFRYEWLVESRPSVFVSCGSPLPPDARDEDLRSSLQSLFDEMAATLAPVNLSTYSEQVKPRMSLNKLWERMTWRGPGPFNPHNE